MPSAHWSWRCSSSPRRRTRSVLPPVVELTFLPCLLGAAVFLILRHTTTRPLHWVTLTAAAVVVVSWTAPLILFLHHDQRHQITIGVLLALLVMHTTPAVLLITTLHRITRTTPAAQRPA